MRNTVYALIILGVITMVTGCSVPKETSIQSHYYQTIKNDYNQWATDNTNFYNTLLKSNFYLTKEKMGLSKIEATSMQQETMQMQKLVKNIISTERNQSQTVQSYPKIKENFIALATDIQKENNITQKTLSLANSFDPFRTQATYVQYRQKITNECSQSNAIRKQINTIITTIR